MLHFYLVNRLYLMLHLPTYLNLDSHFYLIKRLYLMLHTYLLTLILILLLIPNVGILSPIPNDSTINTKRGKPETCANTLRGNQWCRTSDDRRRHFYLSYYLNVGILCQYQKFYYQYQTLESFANTKRGNQLCRRRRTTDNGRRTTYDVRRTTTL